MSFSAAWETLYQSGRHLSVWPWSDLISYVMRYSTPKKPGFRVLELGCGAGANIPFFESLGVEYFAIEGSPTVVCQLHDKFPHLAKNIVAGDFTQAIPFAGPFDLIVDRGSLTCNATVSIQRAFDLLQEKMTDDGKFIGIDWFSTEHSNYQSGCFTIDDFTSDNFSSGHLANTGHIHFSNEAHLRDLLSQFSVQIMEHKVCKRVEPKDNFVFAVWHFVASKNM